MSDSINNEIETDEIEKLSDEELEETSGGVKTADKEYTMFGAAYTKCDTLQSLFVRLGAINKVSVQCTTGSYKITVTTTSSGVVKVSRAKANMGKATVTFRAYTKQKLCDKALDILPYVTVKYGFLG